MQMAHETVPMRLETVGSGGGTKVSRCFGAAAVPGQFVASSISFQHFGALGAASQEGMGVSICCGGVSFVYVMSTTVHAGCTPLLGSPSPSASRPWTQGVGSFPIALAISWRAGSKLGAQIDSNTPLPPNASTNALRRIPGSPYSPLFCTQEW